MDKNFAKKNLMLSAVMLAISCIVLVTVVFGWFVVTKTPAFDNFEVVVVKRNDKVKLNIGGQEVGYEVVINGVIPGDNYEFFLDNSGEQTASYSIFFTELTDNIAEVHQDLNELILQLGVASLDMDGIFSVKPAEGEEYIFLRHLEREGEQLIVFQSVEIQPEERKKIFDLRFEDRYMDRIEDGETVSYQIRDDADIINAFQGINFSIKILVTEVD